MYKNSAERLQLFLLIGIACLILGLIQTAHFYYYFEQPILRSVKWSAKGSIIWMLLFISIITLIRRDRWASRSPSTEIAAWALLALICGALQIFIAVFMDFILGTASRPLLADFEHLYSKRFIQNTSIAALFVMWWRFSLSSDPPAKIQSESPEIDEDQRKLKVNDGTNTWWINIKDISYAESVGNYVCINTCEQQYIIRKTLTTLAQELNNRGFIQISRSVIVNQRFIKCCSRINKNKYEIVTTDGHALGIGRTFQRQVKNSLKV